MTNVADIQITASDIGKIVRFQRQRWSDRLQRHFMNTDLIIVIGQDYEADLMDDIAIYRTLNEEAQNAFLTQLAGTRYAGRMLPEPTPLAGAIEASSGQQFALF